jgi:hypothetical protein
MFSKSASSGVESMNRANNLARQRTAVDILNALILLIKLEGVNLITTIRKLGRGMRY